jgi:hypothetical protein
MSTSTPGDIAASRAHATPLPTRGLWLGTTTAIALVALYLLGIDQGAVSLFGADAHLHELLHDARHLIGFPCH